MAKKKNSKKKGNQPEDQEDELDAQKLDIKAESYAKEVDAPEDGNKSVKRTPTVNKPKTFDGDKANDLQVGDVIFKSKESHDAFVKMLDQVKGALSESHSFKELQDAARKDEIIPLQEIKADDTTRKVAMPMAFARRFLADFQTVAYIPVPELQVITEFEDVVPAMVPSDLKESLLQLMYNKMWLYKDSSQVLGDDQVKLALDNALQNTGLSVTEQQDVKAILEARMVTMMEDVQKRMISPDFIRLALSSVNSGMFTNNNAAQGDGTSISAVIDALREMHTLLSANATNNASLAAKNYPDLMQLFAGWQFKRITGSRSIPVRVTTIINMYLEALGIPALFNIEFSADSFTMANLEQLETFNSLNIGDLVFMWNHVLYLWMGNIVTVNGTKDLWKVRQVGILKPPKVTTVELTPDRERVLKQLTDRLLMYIACRSIAIQEETGTIANHMLTLYEANERKFRMDEVGTFTTLPLIQGGCRIVDALPTLLGTLYDIIMDDSIFHPNVGGLNFIRNNVSKFLQEISGQTTDSPNIRNPLGILKPGSISVLPVILDRQGLPVVSDYTPFFSLPKVTITNNPKIKTWDNGSGPIAFFYPPGDRSDLNKLMNPRLMETANEYDYVYQGLYLEIDDQLGSAEHVVRLVTTSDVEHFLADVLLRDCQKYTLQSEKSILRYLNNIDNVFNLEYSADMFKDIFLVDFDPTKKPIVERSTGWNTIMYVKPSANRIYISTPNWFYQVYETGVRGRELEKVTWPYLGVKYEQNIYDISPDVTALTDLVKTFTQARWKELIKTLELNMSYGKVIEQINAGSTIEEVTDKVTNKGSTESEDDKEDKENEID